MDTAVSFSDVQPYATRAGRTFTFNEDTRINFEVHGNGPCQVLLLHGFGASLETWRDIQPYLEKKHRVFMLDFKGFGLSSKPKDHKYSPEHQAEIVTAFIENQQLQNIALIGHSYGGAVALLTYLRLKDRRAENRIRLLILIDAAGYLQQTLPFFVSLLRIPVVNWIILNFVPARLRATFTLRYLFYYHSAVTAERIERYGRFFDLPGSHGAFIQSARLLRPTNSERITRRIPEVEVPTLVIWGKNDPAVPVEHANRFHHEIAFSKCAIIPSCGHVPQEERPSETATLILGFLREECSLTNLH
jgi:pimeloyl-ACP methyl ester carboxylesterase